MPRPSSPLLARPGAAALALLATLALAACGQATRSEPAKVVSDFQPRVPDTMESSIARSRQVIADDGPGAAGRDSLRQAVLDTARQLRGSACDPKRKQAYLKSVTAYTRAKLRAVKDDYAASEVQWRSLLDAHVIQTFEQQVSDGFVTEDDQLKAVMNHSLAAAAFLRLNAGSEEAPTESTEACERQADGKPQPPLKLKDPRD